MRSLTEEEYQCSHCGQRKRLVLVRRRAWLCEGCYESCLKERRAARVAVGALNKMARELGVE